MAPYFVLNETSLSPHPWLGMVQKKGWGGIRTELGETGNKETSSGHGALLMDSLQLWSPAQDWAG